MKKTKRLSHDDPDAKWDWSKSDLWPQTEPLPMQVLEENWWAMGRKAGRSEEELAADYPAQREWWLYAQMVEGEGRHTNKARTRRKIEANVGNGITKGLYTIAGCMILVIAVLAIRQWWYTGELIHAHAATSQVEEHTHQRITEIIYLDAETLSRLQDAGIGSINCNSIDEKIDCTPVYKTNGKVQKWVFVRNDSAISHNILANKVNEEIKNILTQQGENK